MFAYLDVCLDAISVAFAYSAGPCTVGACTYHKIVPRCVDINKKNSKHVIEL